jgi:hypothetical protein
MYKNISGVRAINRLNGIYNPHVVAGQRALDREREAARLQTPEGIAETLAKKKQAEAHKEAVAMANERAARIAKVWADEQARRKAEAKARKK